MPRLESGSVFEIGVGRGCGYTGEGLRDVGLIEDGAVVGEVKEDVCFHPVGCDPWRRMELEV